MDTVIGSSAVVWIDAQRAIVATSTGGAEAVVSEISAPGDDGEDSTYLARVVDAIGDRERVVIMGPDDSRLALEREYVAIDHRPERLIDVEPAGPLDRDDVVARLNQLRS